MRISGGFLLAATIAEDDAVATARGGMTPASAERLAPEAKALADRSPAERRAVIRRRAASLREPPRADAELPARARALLAGEVPRDVGRIWLAAAPKPRRGWAAPAELRAVLRRASREARPGDPELADRERGAGRELVARWLRTVDEAERSAMLDALGPEEAGAVLALERLLGPEGDGLDPSARAAMVHVARSTPGLAPPERTRAAGALLLGWGDGEETAGDALSRPFWRAGREMRELMEAGCHG